MSKKNKIVYSDVQPNAKEAGVWVNTTDGNVKVEKDGKWVDDGGSGSGESGKTDSYALYYKFDDWTNVNPYWGQTPMIANVRTYYNWKYQYSSWGAAKEFHASHSENPWPDAFVFLPSYMDDGEHKIVAQSYEELCEMFTNYPKATRITAEEYWEHFNEANES